MALLTRGFCGQTTERSGACRPLRELTWSELDVAVNRTIDALRTTGLRPGDTIAIIAGNRKAPKRPRE